MYYVSCIDNVVMFDVKESVAAKISTRSWECQKTAAMKT